MVTHTFVNLDIPEAEYLSDLIGVEYDLATTIEWCVKYNEIFMVREFAWVWEPFNSAILVRFVRAFSKGVRVTTKDLLSCLNEDQRSRFDYYKDLRDKYIAHSVNALEANHVKAYYIQERPDEGVKSIEHGCERITAFSINNVNEIKDLAQYLLIEVHNEIESEKRKVYEYARRTITPDDLIKMSAEAMPRLKDINITESRKKG